MDLEQITLLEPDGQVFEIIMVPAHHRGKPILFAERIFMPTKTKGQYKQPDFYHAPLPRIKSLTGT